MDAKAIAEQWFARVAETYPEQTARFLRQESDAFRNPVGSGLRDALTTLTEEVLGDMDASKIKAAIDTIIRVRAVQDFSPSEAVAFVFALKDVLGSATRATAAEVHSRVDRLALAAFDTYMNCREQIAQIRVREAKAVAMR